MPLDTCRAVLHSPARCLRQNRPWAGPIQFCHYLWLGSGGAKPFLGERQLSWLCSMAGAMLGTSQDEGTAGQLPASPSALTLGHGACPAPFGWVGHQMGALDGHQSHPGPAQVPPSLCALHTEAQVVCPAPQEPRTGALQRPQGAQNSPLQAGTSAAALCCCQGRLSFPLPHSCR